MRSYLVLPPLTLSGMLIHCFDLGSDVHVAAVDTTAIHCRTASDFLNVSAEVFQAPYALGCGFDMRCRNGHAFTEWPSYVGLLLGT